MDHRAGLVIELLQLITEGYTSKCTHVGSLLKPVGMENIWDEHRLPVSVDNFKQQKAGYTNVMQAIAKQWMT